MPLARLSIKSATKLALHAVVMRRLSDGRYQVTRSDAVTSHKSGRMSLPKARRRLRVDRIFTALVHLGLEGPEALALAGKHADTDVIWQTAVGLIMERRTLVKPRCLYPTCSCSVPVPFVACSKGLE